MSFLSILLIIVIAVLVCLFIAYNKLRQLAETVKQKQANIYATVKKRHDIAQRLSDIASSYGDHEKLAHLTITESDAGIAHANASETSRMIGNIHLMANRFPDLKANSTYQQLMVQLEEIENSVLDRREAYNTAVKTYNSTRGSIPHLFYASKLGFVEAQYFEVDESGFEQLASFKTDDGKILRDTMNRMATLATENVKKVKTQINKNTDVASQDDTKE